MGRYLLLIVFAAGVGGTVLTVGTRGTLNATAQRAAEGQADVLAREIAQAGQSAALTAMLGDEGFRDPTSTLGSAKDYEGGRFSIAYSPGSTDREATIQVTGAYGGASHTIESTYAYDPMDAPGPMWLDVPYATASSSRGASVDGGGEAKPVVFDRRKHDELELEGLLPLAGLPADVGAAITSAGSELSIPAADSWAAPGGLLDHMNVSDAEGLYAKALGALDVSAGDRSLAGNQTLAGRQTFGNPAKDDGIFLVDGDLTVTGRVTGYGVLLVNGALRVAPDDPATARNDPGRLDWKGIVMVRSTNSVLPLELDGEMSVEGMLVVNHQAFAPGGHLDVSVYRDLGGMSDAAPGGDLSEQRSPWTSARPWHQHTHAFDIKPTASPRGDHVYFLEGGRAGRHENEVQLHSLLSRLGSEEVYLEIANADNHGFSRYGLQVDGSDGTPGLMEGTIQGGFRDFARAGTPLRTRAFPADDFTRLDIDVQSLRALRQSFDDASCSSWPVCIGNDWDRRGAMAVRVHRASDGARLYEASLYWHMRTDEADTHAAEEAAWRERIRSGEAFGTHLTLSDGVDLEFDIARIDALSDRLDFDGDNVRLISSRSSHIAASEPGAAAPLPPVAGGPSTPGGGASNGTTKICLGGITMRIRNVDLPLYLGMGATRGKCDDDDDDGPPTDPTPTDPTPTDPPTTGPPPSGPTPPPGADPIPSSPPAGGSGPADKVWICHWSDSLGMGQSQFVAANSVPAHYTHPADYMGRCDKAK